MRALPEHLQVGADRAAAGLVCPDCSGAISVAVLGGATSAFLYFACRIGHSYSTAEFLEAKEQRALDAASQMKLVEHHVR